VIPAQPRSLVPVLLLASACEGLFGLSAPVLPPCQSDDECGPGAVCFPDGCGDPGSNLAVEITPNVASGHFEQDFAIPELRTPFDLELPGPSAIEATLLRFVGAVALQGQDLTLPYAGTVTFSLNGESAVIPGLRRRQALQRASTDGLYRLPVASGNYSVSLITQDAALPPLALGGLSIQPGDVVPLDVNLPSSRQLLRVDGRLLRTEGIAVQTTVMEIQALNPLTQQPLSQRVPVSSGQTGSTGDFTLFAAPEARALPNIVLLATPRDGTAAVPSRAFEISTRELLRSPLELGDYGPALLARGRVLDAAGAPVARAVVYLEGLVEGGGQLTTEKVITLADGTFELKALPSRSDSRLRLTVLPPPDAAAALHRRAVALAPEALDLGDISCPDRIAVQGVLRGADGASPVAGARIVAEPLAPVDGLPLPNPGAEARTGEDGSYVLMLDPGAWRLDVYPAEPQLPRASRFLTLHDQAERSLQLPPLGLSNGRRVTGTIRAGGPHAPNAAVRFYRVVKVEGRPSSVVLAETVADSAGRYEVVLPTR